MVRLKEAQKKMSASGNSFCTSDCGAVISASTSASVSTGTCRQTPSVTTREACHHTSSGTHREVTMLAVQRTS